MEWIRRQVTRLLLKLAELTKPKLVVAPIDFHKENQFHSIVQTSLERTTYNAFSGVDIRVFLDGNPILACEGVGFESKGDLVEGWIKVLVINEVWWPKGTDLCCIAANEYGKACVLANFTELEWVSRSSSFTVDSMMVEETWRFRGKSWQPKALGVWDMKTGKFNVEE